MVTRYSDKNLMRSVYDKLSKDFGSIVSYDSNSPLSIMIGQNHKVSLSHEVGYLDLILECDEGSVDLLAEKLKGRFSEIDHGDNPLSQMKMLASRRVCQNGSGDYVVRLQFKRELFNIQRSRQPGVVGVIQSFAIYKDALSPLIELLKE